MVITRSLFLGADFGASDQGVEDGNLADFSAYFEKILDELFIDRMEGNEEIFSCVMTDPAFRAIARLIGAV